jgi:hypothetical protein
VACNHAILANTTLASCYAINGHRWTLLKKVETQHDIKVTGKSRIRLLYEMEKHFDVRDIDYFKKLLGHEDNVSEQGQFAYLLK